jgi:ADP-L-glycero-D-manno-heptose 6-epimerase
MPADLRDRYQYFTRADIGKLTRAGYQGKLHDLESAVKDYVVHYLVGEKYLDTGTALA